VPGESSSPPFTGERAVAAVHEGENCRRRRVRASECFPASDGVVVFAHMYSHGSGVGRGNTPLYRMHFFLE
jgi:hypothetical protein